MKDMKVTDPIGIFDSGIGGLTVAKAIDELLPNESFIYFGDTAHTPWGDKSKSAILTYAKRIIDVLLEQECKLIVVACNTASTTALDVIQEHIGNRVPVLNVLDPIIEHIGMAYQNQQIGVIGTKQTIASGAYQSRLCALPANLSVRALPTPLLCPLIEEGFTHQHPLPKLVLQEYLSQTVLKDIDALVLACTHYPLLKPLIEEHYNHQVDVIDSATLVAHALGRVLKKENLQNPHNSATRRFLVTDINPCFEKIAKLFFSESIQLEPYELF